MNINKRTIIIAASAAAAAIVILLIVIIYNRSEMQEMVEVFTEEKQLLISEYQDLSLDYDSLRSNNDELNQKLELERERIAQLKEELQTVKATNARRIRELQTELTTMRSVMRTFVKQIDSLNQINVKLAAENKDMRSQVAQVKRSYNKLEEQNKELSNKVTVASRLETSNIAAVGLTYKEKKATSVDKVAKIKVSFTILKNVTAEVGNRAVYMRLTRPDGQLLMHSASDTFSYEDSQINYSAMRTVEYGGEDTETYIVYKVDAGELMSGNYEIELFSGGESIGKGSFTLK